MALGCYIPCSWAVRVGSIYQAQVPVASQTEATRQQALPQALEQVLVKVSGSGQVANNPLLKAQLPSAAGLMQEFGYKPSENAAKPYWLTVQFTPAGIDTLLKKAAVPIWGMNRPLVLGWVEYEMPNVPAELIDSTSQSPVLTLLKQRASQRGLPLILPVMDMVDMSRVGINDIVEMKESVLLEAAKRYKSDVVLIARVFKLTDGYSVNAKVFLGTDHWGWEIHGPALPDVINRLVDQMTDTLAGRYATVVSNTVQEDIAVKITGITQQSDFSQLMQYLQRLPPVSNVQIKHISGTEVEVILSVRGNRDTLTQIITSGAKLSAVPNEAHQLIYQWNR